MSTAEVSFVIARRGAVAVLGLAWPGNPPSGTRRPTSVKVFEKVRHMAEYGEWNRKDATLSDVTAEKEYGVTRDFIVEAIQAGKLEYREGSTWGNPYLRVLRSQLEAYIVARFGLEHLTSKRNATELRAVNKEIAAIRKKLSMLEARRTELQRAVKT